MGLRMSSGLICPHCEKELAEHDQRECTRRMSRRFFFGLMGGAVAAVAAGNVTQGETVAYTLDLTKCIWTYQDEQWVAIARQLGYQAGKTVELQIQDALHNYQR